MSTLTVPPTSGTPAPKSLSRNTALMALGTVLSRLTGFGRIFALAYAFDFALPSDTYNLANNAPNIVYELILGGILAATLIPVFVTAFSRRTDDEAWEAVSAIFTTTATVLIVLTVVVAVGAPWIIDLYTIGKHSAQLNEQRSVATNLLRLFAPQVVFYGFIGLATALLQARRRFAPPMFAPIFNNVVVIAMLLALPHFTHDLSLEGILANRQTLLILGLGTTAGVLAMAVFLVPYVHSVARGKVRLLFDFKHEAVRSVIQLSGWTIGFVLGNQIALLVTFVLANRGQVGAFSAFLSAYTFFILPHGIFSVSVMSALQPDMAEQWATNRVTEFRAQVGLGLRLITAIMLPAAVGYCLLAEPMVTVVLQHGHFTHRSAGITADLIFYMALGLPGFSAFIFLTRSFQAMQDAKTVFYLYLGENGLNIITAPFLYFYMGVNGLAVSQSLSYTVAALGALAVLRARIHNLGGRMLMKTLLNITIASAVMGLAVGLTIHFVGESPIVELSAGILTGAIAYLGSAHMLRMSELDVLLRSRGRPTNRTEKV